MGIRAKLYKKVLLFWIPLCITQVPIGLEKEVTDSVNEWITEYEIPIDHRIDNTGQFF